MWEEQHITCADSPCAILRSTVIIGRVVFIRISAVGFQNVGVTSTKTELAAAQARHAWAARRAIVK